jgi:hypothetical protein
MVNIINTKTRKLVEDNWEKIYFSHTPSKNVLSSFTESTNSDLEETPNRSLRSSFDDSHLPGQIPEELRMVDSLTNNIKLKNLFTVFSSLTNEQKSCLKVNNFSKMTLRMPLVLLTV